MNCDFFSWTYLTAPIVALAAFALVSIVMVVVVPIALELGSRITKWIWP